MGDQNHKKERAGRRGFGMVDILIAACLLAVLVGLAIPSFGDMMRAVELEGSAQQIASKIGLARMRAAAKMTRCRVTLDPVSRSYRLETWDSAQSLFKTEGAVSRLPDGTSFLFEAPVRITFNSMGIAIDDNDMPTSSSVVLSEGPHVVTVSVSSSGDVKTERSGRMVTTS